MRPDVTKSLIYKVLSGFFRHPPGSSGYCNIKCLLTVVAGQTFLHGWTEKVAATRYCSWGTLAAFLVQVTPRALEALHNIKLQSPCLIKWWLIGADLMLCQNPVLNGFVSDFFGHR